MYSVTQRGVNILNVAIAYASAIAMGVGIIAVVVVVLRRREWSPGRQAK